MKRRSLRLLVVEDERITRLELVRRLINLGYVVCGQTGSGEEAILLAAQVAPDMVLMDVTLEGELDGIFAAEAIHRELQLPVVFLTADDSPDALERAMGKSIAGYLLKPYTDSELCSAITLGRHLHALGSQLTHSEARYRKLVESLGEGLFTMDVSGNIGFANRSMAALLGLPAERLPGRNMEDFLDPLGCQALRDGVEQLRQGQPRQFELVVRSTTGELRDVLLSASPRFASNWFVGLQATVADVTERKRTERALREAEERYRHIFEHALVGIFHSNIHGRVYGANPTLATMLGYKDPGELVANLPDLFTMLFAETEAGETFRRRLLHFGRVDGMEAEVYGRDGDVLWVSLSACLAADSHGEMQINGTLLDISQRREAEQAFSASFELLSRTVDAMADPVALIDLEGHIILANEALSMALCMDKDKVKAYRYQDLLSLDVDLAPMQGKTCQEVWVRGSNSVYLETATPFNGPGGQVIGTVRVLRSKDDVIYQLSGAASPESDTLHQLARRIVCTNISS